MNLCISKLCYTDIPHIYKYTSYVKRTEGVMNLRISNLYYTDIPHIYKYRSYVKKQSNVSVAEAPLSL